MQLDHSHDRRVRSATEHCVQFYDSDTGALTRRVANFIAEGCRRGETTLVVATAVHREAFLTALSDSRVVAAAIAAGTLVLRDVLDMLDRIVVRGYPQRDRFDASIGALVREGSTRNGEARVRAYGEMVGVLWQAAQYPAAI